MIQLHKDEFSCLRPLCQTMKEEIMLQWFLECNPACYAWTDSLENPKTALILAADFAYILGECNHQDEVRDRINQEGRYKIYNTNNPEWYTYLETEFTNQIVKDKRYKMTNPEKFDSSKLGSFIEQMDSSYILKKIDEKIYHEVLTMDWAADGCCFYESYEDFQQKGLGYVVYKDMQLVGIASSYNTYQNCIGVTIGVLEEHRGKGIALACASQLILECEEKGICPMWEAANPASVALAQKLGYQYQTEYEICIIM